MPSDDHDQASLVAGAPRLDHDLIGDHERRIEADAELADQIGGAFLGLIVGAQFLEKGAGAGAGDRAERLDELLAAHADAIVGEGQRFFVGVNGDADGEWTAAFDKLGAGERLVTQFLAGVGGVGDELANENIAVRIDRMDHQIKEARNVGLEILRLGLARIFAVRIERRSSLAPRDEEETPAAVRRAPAGFISREWRDVSSRFEQTGFSKKKRTGWEGSRRSAGLRGKAPIQLAARGLGG